MATKTYDLNLVSLTVNGLLVRGAGEDDKVTVTRRGDSNELTMGGDGEGVFSRMNDKSGQFEITMLDSNDGNKLLLDLHNAEEVVAGAGLFSIGLRDSQLGDTYAGAEAKVMKFADSPKGKGVSERTWTVACPLLAVDRDVV